MSGTLRKGGTLNQSNQVGVGGGVPVTVSGGRGVGAVVTATPATGWAITAGQWYGDAAAISGATGLTYTRLLADIGKELAFVPTGLPFRASAGTTLPSAPDAPTLNSVTAGNGQAVAAYTAGASNGGATATFTAYAFDSANNIVSTATGASPLTLAGLTNNVTYRVVVAASNSGGTSLSNALNVTPVTAPIVQVVPFDSTQTFAQGTQVLYAGGLYTFNTAHPAGNWIGSDATYNGQAGAVTRNTVGFSKPFGVVGNWSNGAIVTTATSVPATSRGMKLQMEAPFTRLKVHLYQRDANPTRGLAMSVASTETDATGSLSNGIDPIVGGVAYSVLRANSQYGFDRLKWNTLGRSPVQAPGAVSPPGQNYMTGLSTAESDWSNTSSVPPAVAGKLPMIVTRWNRIANVGDSASNIIVSAMTGSYNAYVAGEPLSRLYYCPSVGTGDHVANPALSKSGATAYNPTTEGIWNNMAFAAEHGISTRNFYAFGDSITEGYQWWQNAVRTLTTQSAPCYIVNFGCSTNRAAQYLPLFHAVMRRENWATDIIMPSFSPNEGSAVLETDAPAFIAGLQEVIDTCVAYKKRLYIWTSYAGQPTGIPAGKRACVQAVNAWVRTEAAKPDAKFLLMEIDNGYDDTTMTRSDDKVHPNDLGIAYMMGRCLTTIQKGV